MKTLDVTTSQSLLREICCLLAIVGAAGESGAEPLRLVADKYGAIVRGDMNDKALALVFTGDEYGESFAPILDTLKQRQIKASFFVTGRLVRQEEFGPLLERAIAEGHYIGPHSDSHPLYAAWDQRDKSLVTKAFFRQDLKKNLAALGSLGAVRRGQPIYFVPPYEHYNGDQVKWSREMDITLINFTPGSGSNRDYAREGDPRFFPSRTIYDDILAYEKKDPSGLNGFLLLLHLGSGRKAPFHPLLGPLCDELGQRGYRFRRVDQLLSSVAAENPVRSQ
jgi:peptidoglycan/xylan/chitin deacetylase (PgdA/CDA1 family)